MKTIILTFIAFVFLAISSAEAQKSFLLWCRGPLNYNVDPDGSIDLVLRKHIGEARENGQNLPRNSCAWVDRPLSQNEPNIIYFPDILWYKEAADRVADAIALCANNSDCLLGVRAFNDKKNQLFLPDEDSDLPRLRIVFRNAQVFGISEEVGIDRPGADFLSFLMETPDPTVCQRRCMNDTRCQAYTFVKPGVQHRLARCWMKNAIPEAQSNSCCVSGVRGR